MKSIINKILSQFKMKKIQLFKYFLKAKTPPILAAVITAVI